MQVRAGRSAVLLILFLFVSLPSFSDTAKETQWVLGASEFTFTQKHSDRTSREREIAALVPKLILEQISSSSKRHTSNQEILDRKLSELLTERISLFLQLSKEIKTRDSLILTQSDLQKRKKALADSEKKIKEIKDKIDENLKKQEKAKEEFNERVEHEKKIKEENSTDKKNEAPVFPDLFKPKEDAVLPASSHEAVTLYKNDSSELFKAGDEVLSKGLDSREFEKAVTAAGIKGLISGTITIYGDYASVTTSLRIFPGNKVEGTITEVGSLSDVSSMAQNIAHYLVPKITNSRPINLFFDIVPSECKKNAQIAVDGVLYQKVPEKILVDSGIHTIEVSCPEYTTQTITYNFEDTPDFLVHVPLEKAKNARVNVLLKEPVLGTLYANGAFAGDVQNNNPGASVTVNGSPVIGQFISRERAVKKVSRETTDKDGKKTVEIVEEPGDFLSSFYYIDSSTQTDGANLLINVNPKDNASEIDKRRIWMYRGYTALVLSVPVSLFGTGRYNTTYNSYSIGGSGTTQADVQFWDGFRWASLGVTIAAGSFFIFEIVRYLKAASEVIPKNARPASDGEVSSSIEKSLHIISDEASPKTEMTNDNSDESGKSVDENVKENIEEKNMENPEEK